MSSAVLLFNGLAKERQPLSLCELCVKTLQKWVECIADLGFLAPSYVRDVLSGASTRTLAQVEDGTR